MTPAEAAAAVRELVAAVPDQSHLPLCERTTAMIECPDRCGFVTAAEASVHYGPWRMQVHLIRPEGARCPTPGPGMTASFTNTRNLRRATRGHR